MRRLTRILTGVRMIRQGDADCDGTVDVNDLLIVLAGWSS